MHSAVLWFGIKYGPKWKSFRMRTHILKGNRPWKSCGHVAHKWEAAHAWEMCKLKNPFHIKVAWSVKSAFLEKLWENVFSCKKTNWNLCANDISYHELLHSMQMVREQSFLAQNFLTVILLMPSVSTFYLLLVLRLTSHWPSVCSSISE